MTKRQLLFALLIVFILWTLGTALTQVKSGERAVVRRFGQIVAEKPKPGLYVGLPWGMERVDSVPIGRVRRVLVGITDEQADDETTRPGQLLTGDHNLVNVQAEIYYSVVEEDVADYLVQAERVDGLIARATESALAGWVAGRTVDEILVRGQTLLPPVLVNEVRSRIEPYHLGVRIEEASVKKLYPPEEVKQAFDQVAQAHTAISSQIFEAEQQAQRKRREAESAALRIERLAAAYAHEQHLQADVEADNFLKRLAQYRELRANDPDIINAMWQDEMTALYGRMRKSGRIDVLDHYLSGEGLNISQFPLPVKKN